MVGLEEEKAKERERNTQRHGETGRGSIPERVAVSRDRAGEGCEEPKRAEDRGKGGKGWGVLVGDGPRSGAASSVLLLFLGILTPPRKWPQAGKLGGQGCGSF